MLREQAAAFTCYDGSYNWGHFTVRDLKGGAVEVALETTSLPMTNEHLSVLGGDPTHGSKAVKRLKATFAPGACVRSKKDWRLLECIGQADVPIQASSDRFASGTDTVEAGTVSLTGFANVQVKRIETINVHGLKVIRYAAALTAGRAGQTDAVTVRMETLAESDPNDLFCRVDSTRSE